MDHRDRAVRHVVMHGCLAAWSGLHGIAVRSALMQTKAPCVAGSQPPPAYLSYTGV